ncbi:MAG TPA: secretin N-terminal domain-containing protein [Gallionella sp.]|nr:secretin N-terminal domain-containing protein [Gallionella sp.]
MKKTLALLLLLPLSALAAKLEVIELKHRSAEELLPIVRPLLDKDGVASGMDYRLILRTSPRNLAEIRKLLGSIDVAPRKLRITVMQDVDRDTIERLTSVSGSVGRNPRITLPGSGGGAGIEAGQGRDRLRADVVSTRSLDMGRNSQQLQVLEGNRALVRTGQSVPLPQRQVIQNSWGSQVIDTTEYREVERGFYVLPRVNGDRVTLEISAQNDAQVRGDPLAVNTQQASSTLSGRLGEWMELGGTGMRETVDEGTISSRSAARKSEQRSVLIRVEEVE